MSDSKTTNKTFRIPEGSLWASAWKMSLAVALIGTLIALAGAVMQPQRFAFSYLYGFVTAMTLWLGTVFFVLIQHLTGAGWSVSVRRAAEFGVSGAWVLPFLFLPMLMNFGTLYPWWNAGHDGVAHAQHGEADGHGHDHGAHGGHDHGDHAQGTAADDHGAAAASHGPDATPRMPAALAQARRAGEHALHEAHHGVEQTLLSKKTWYLNHTFFFVRMAAYFLIWCWLALRLFGYSVAQDQSGDKQYTVKLQSVAPAATALFALSLTFAGFDWVMSLEPLWYSTMFGVRVFAASAVTSFAFIILVTMGWKRAGLVGNEINTEHFHDLGKLMFGFLVFWAYISFSEFFLIWYAAIPEETVYYHRRWFEGSWRAVSIVLVTLKFIVPFYVIISRNAKRNAGILGFAAAWLLGFHLIEMYYWIMPNFAPMQPVQFSGIWIEIGCVMATVGFYLTFVFRNMTKHSLIAVGDPRLPRAIDFVNA